MQTTVTAVAGDKVSFYWKVSSDYGDYLKFYIDGQYQTGITGEVDWQKKSYNLSAGSRTLKWVYSKDSSGYGGDDCGWVDGLKVGATSFVGQPDAMSEALDSQLKFTQSGTGTWYNVSGTTHEYYYEADAAESEAADDEEACLQAIVDSDSSQTVKFYWKVSSVQGYDYLQFYIDGTLKDQISGEVAWTQKSYAVSSGIHILKWRYVKDGSGYSGDDCGWVDFVQWTGPAPKQDPSNWQEIAYKHDVTGRRVEKNVDGYEKRGTCTDLGLRKVSCESGNALKSFDFAQWTWPSLTGDGEPVEPFYIDGQYQTAGSGNLPWGDLLPDGSNLHISQVDLAALGSQAYPAGIEIAFSSPVDFLTVDD